MGSNRKKIVYSYVVADLLHVGHLHFLEKAKKEGDYLIVGVLTDEATMEKKLKPIISFSERWALINALACVDEAIAQETYSPLANVNAIKPGILIESDSHQEQPANEFVESYCGKVVVLPYFDDQSSTKIKQKIYENKRKGS